MVIDLNSKIYIAGHNGMVGSAILGNLQNRGFTNFVFTPYPEFDLTDQKTVQDFFQKEKPEYVIDAAAKVGGILANDTYRAQFIYENLMIQNNIIHSSYLHGIKKLLFLGSSCIYPKNCPQPMKEEYLLTGPLEPTNEPYAIAKIAGIKMCENYYRQYGCNFISVMPTNLYGPNDNYNLETSHVMPALIRKYYLGKCLENNDWDAIRKDLSKRPIENISGRSNKNEISLILYKYGIKQIDDMISITLWGTGSPSREFLHVDDMADACVHIFQNINAQKLYNELKNTHINIGTGQDLTINELAKTIREIIGFKKEIQWDSTYPDGSYKKQLDITLLKSLNWRPKIPLSDGIRSVYKHYLK